MKNPVMNKNRLYTFPILLALFLSITGCQKAVDFSSFSEGYDKAIEKTANQNVFLNIVRSAYQKPMHFASVLGVFGTSSLSSPSASLTTPIDQVLSLSRNGASNLLTLPSFIQSSSVTVSPLTTAEFLEGFLTQLDPSTLQFYTSQGLPRELIFLLMIDSIEITVDGSTDLYRNDPILPEYSDFTEMLNILITMGLTTETVSGFSPSGPILNERQAKDPLRLSMAASAGLLLSPLEGSVSDEYQMLAPFEYSRFCFLQTGQDAEILPTSVLCGGDEQAVNKGTLETSTKNGRGKLEGGSVKIVTRSTKGVFQYLGKLIYQQVENGKSMPVTLTSAESKQYNFRATGDALFVVKKNNSRRDDIVSVNFGGDTYSIPAVDRGFSTNVLALIIDLLNLSKSVNSLAPANTVITK